MLVKKSRKEVDNIAKKSTINNNRYKKKTFKTYQLRLRKDTEQDLIEKMESQENQKNNYLKNLIKQDLNK